MEVREETCLFILSHSCIWKGITESLWQVLPGRANPAAEPHTAVHINITLGVTAQAALCLATTTTVGKKTLTMEPMSQSTVTQ